MTRAVDIIRQKVDDWAMALYHGRRFGRRDGTRVLIFYERQRISFSQVFPFVHFSSTFRTRYDTSLRFLPNTALFDDSADRLGWPDIVILQTWFDWDGDRLAQAFDRIRALNPDARIIYMDSFAPNDLRLARHVDPHVTFYLKKALFRDTSLYFKPFRGDTNLTEFYGDRYGLTQPPVDWQVPESILPKLRLSPGFFTAPMLMPLFARGDPPPPPTGRRIDVHARMQVEGAAWYARMRQESLAALATAPGVHVTATARLPWTDFMAELQDSRLCLSSFGFGEVCWRDSEAHAAGSAVVKQDMGHLRTRPDIYEVDATYVPIRWDFEDLADTIAALLDDPDRQQRIARTAFDLVADYLAEDRFVTDMAELFR